MTSDHTAPLPSTPPSRFDDLYRRVRLTTATRFQAAHRLQRHEKLAQWTVALLSVSLIVLPLLQAMGVVAGLTTQALNALQVVLAVLVLVFSLLISRDNHGVRAERMHRCGMELGALARQLESYRGKDASDAVYDDLTKTYDGILRRYENHEPVDWLMIKVANRAEFYPGDTLGWLWNFARSQFTYWLSFAPYFLIIAIMIFAYWLMSKPLFPNSPSAAG
jgi:hypothetical protein